MLSNDHNDHSNPGKDEAAAQSTGLSAAGSQRRRLAGLGASGVLMTLASKGAMAGAAGMVCKSPSAALSGNLASRTPDSVTCNGGSPGFWKNLPKRASDWQKAGVQPTALFSSIFSCGGLPGYSTVTCYDILTHKDYDHNNLGMQIMCAYLNVGAEKISFLKSEDLTSMWTEITTSGQYVPGANAKPWTRQQLASYLESIHE